MYPIHNGIQSALISIIYIHLQFHFFSFLKVTSPVGNNIQDLVIGTKVRQVIDEVSNSGIHDKTYVLVVFPSFHQCPVLSTKTSASLHLLEVQSIVSSFKVVLTFWGDPIGGLL